MGGNFQSGLSLPYQLSGFSTVHPTNIWRFDDQEKLRAAIARACPKLEDLFFITDLIHIKCFQCFQNLTSLSWSGYALSSPQETLSILNTLPRLRDVQLEIWLHVNDCEHCSGLPGQLHQYTSFTCTVLQGLGR